MIGELEFVTRGPFARATFTNFVFMSSLSCYILLPLYIHRLGGTEAEKLGAQRLVREVLAMPAEARVGRRGSRLSLKVPQLHPWARALVRGTEARFPPSGWRTIWRKN